MQERPGQGDGTFYPGAFEETLIGIVRFHREEGIKDRQKGFIFRLSVLPARRGRAAGKALMQEMIARAKQMVGLEQLHLSVVTTSLAAHHLYRSPGFQVYGTEPRALKLDEQYWDEDLMMLDLREGPMLDGPEPGLLF